MLNFLLFPDLAGVSSTVLDSELLLRDGPSGTCSAASWLQLAFGGGVGFETTWSPRFPRGCLTDLPLRPSHFSVTCSDWPLSHTDSQRVSHRPPHDGLTLPSSLFNQSFRGFRPVHPSQHPLSWIRCRRAQRLISLCGFTGATYHFSRVLSTVRGSDSSGMSDIA